MKKAVIFDLDGTLLDTLSDLGRSMNRVLVRLGFSIHGLDEYKLFVGEGLRMLALRVLPEEQRDDDTVAKVIAGMQEEYGRSWKDETRPYEGIPELLSALQRRGVETAVLSNKPHEFTHVMVKEFFPSYGFRCVFGARDSVPRKPDPRGALDIVAALKTPIEDFCLLGDTRTDMETARNAGILPIGALWGFRTAEELEASGAAFLIARPEELLDRL